MDSERESAMKESTMCGRRSRMSLGWNPETRVVGFQPFIIEESNKSKSYLYKKYKINIFYKLKNIIVH